MPKIAIYPGTFDPITFGHIDVIKKSLKFVDKLIVATTDSPSKDYLFDTDERVEVIKKSLFHDIKIKKNKITVVSFDQLTVKLCKKYKDYHLKGLSCIVSCNDGDLSVPDLLLTNSG